MSAITSFSEDYVPILWDNLLAVFGCTVSYWVNNDSATAFDVPCIWKEGVENEEVSPGRYSNIWVQNSFFAKLPALGDTVVKDSLEYDIVRIDATAYGYSRLVLQERTLAY